MRLDVWLFDNGIYKSRNKASEAIKRGDVSVNGKVVEKTAYELSENDRVEILTEENRFVSNGGYKLQKAFDDFSINCDGKTCVDVGASTGGFTDCLLKNGAKKVFAVDVGESLMDNELKFDKRVVVVDNFNARNLCAETLGEYVDFAVCDVSFISLTYVLKPIFDVLKIDGTAVTLVKPQFECGKKQLNKNGIVTDRKARIDALKKICDYASAVGFSVCDISTAPVRDGKNIEYLLKLSKNKNKSDIGLFDFGTLV